MSELQLPRWQITDPSYIIDRSVVENQTVEVKEPRGDDLTAFDKFQLNLEDTDAWYILGEAKVHVEFDLKYNGSLPTEDHGIVLQDGFGLFSRAELSFNGQEVEAINEPGTAHFFRHLSEYSEDYDQIANKQIWYPVTKKDHVVNTKTGAIQYNPLLVATQAVYAESRQPPGGLDDLPHNYGTVAHNDDIPDISPSPYLKGDFYVFSSAGDSAGAGKFALGVVAVGDIALYVGPTPGQAGDNGWRLVTIATQNSERSSVLGSGWLSYLPENYHRAEVGHGYFPLDNSAGDDQGSALRQGVRPNPQYVASYDAGVRRLLTAGNQKCILPLNELFGTLQTAGLKATRGTSITVDLYKNKTPAAILYAKGKTAVNSALVTLNIKKLSLFVPRVKPSVQMRQDVQNILATIPEIRQDYPCYQVFRFQNIAATQTANRLKIVVDSNRMLYALVMFSLSTKRTAINQNPHQCSIDNDILINWVRMKNHSKEFPSEPYSISNGDLPRMYDDTAELFGKIRGADDFNKGMFIDLDQYADVHSVVSFNMQDSDPAVTEQFRSSDLELQYNLSAQPVGTYDVTVITCSKKQIIAKHIGGSVKLMK